MEANIIMVRYGELSTKGKNKGDFIRLLGTNIRHALKKFKNLRFEVKHDHTYIHLNGETYRSVANRLKDVSGIHSFSPVYKVDLGLSEHPESAPMTSNKADHKEFSLLILPCRICR